MFKLLLIIWVKDFLNQSPLILLIFVAKMGPKRYIERVFLSTRGHPGILVTI